MRVAVDIGGTFTDAVVIDDDGHTRAAKALTTPRRLYDGVLAALDQLDIDWQQLDSITNGTTAGLNAFLGASGRQGGAAHHPRVSRRVRVGSSQPAGHVQRPLPAPHPARSPPVDLRGGRAHRRGRDRTGRHRRGGDRRVGCPAGPGLRGGGDLLPPFLRQSGPRAAGRRTAARNSTGPCRWSALPTYAPEWREYERTSTTAIAAYVAPIVDSYLAELEKRTSERGMRGSLRVMQSNGGVMAAASARRKPIQTLFSGPVGGTIACLAVADDLLEEAAASRLICVDMGGTSFDMSLVVDGRADVELESELQRHPVLAPTVAIHTIGAGGGSVGHTAGGGLRVGPRSAGAVPGPACYGSGGVEPTITDANLHLGRLPRVARLAGGIALDKNAAEDALSGVAGSLGMDRLSLAAGMIAVADATMANAIREITVMRGIDPRDFILVAFGGAGPLHATSLARRTRSRHGGGTREPGGPVRLRHAADRHPPRRRPEFLRPGWPSSPRMLWRPPWPPWRSEPGLMVKEDGFDDQAITLEPSADLRYSGQEYTVTLPLDTGRGMKHLIDEIPDQFAEAHNVRYGHSNPGEAVEFVNLRMAAFGGMTRPRPQTIPPGRLPEPVTAERTWFGDAWFETPVFHRSSLPSGVEIGGPAVVLEDACTTLVPPSWTTRVSRHGHLVLSRV